MTIMTDMDEPILVLPEEMAGLRFMREIPYTTELKYGSGTDEIHVVRTNRGIVAEAAASYVRLYAAKKIGLPVTARLVEVRDYMVRPAYVRGAVKSCLLRIVILWAVIFGIVCLYWLILTGGAR